MIVSVIFISFWSSPSGTGTSAMEEDGEGGGCRDDGLDLDTMFSLVGVGPVGCNGEGLQVGIV